MEHDPLDGDSGGVGTVGFGCLGAEFRPIAVWGRQGGRDLLPKASNRPCPDLFSLCKGLFFILSYYTIKREKKQWISYIIW